MNFRLTAEHVVVRDAAREFAQKKLLPGVIERDTHQRFAAEEIKAMSELGFMGMMVNPKYHGGGMDTISYVLAMEELSKIDASVSVCMSVHNSLVCWGIEQYGTEEQKEKYLKKLATGEMLGAFCLSEPEAGSDATYQHTYAENKGNYYVLNGVKNWVTNGNSADLYIVAAQSDATKKHKGINVFIVEKGVEGFCVGEKEDKMGIRGSDTHSLMFTDVVIPKANRIGNDGFGFSFVMYVLNGGRIGISAQALGIAAGAYELALGYSKERKTFKKSLCKHEDIQMKLAEMATKIEAARLLVWQAAQQKDQQKDFVKEASMAKLYASKIAQEVTTEAVQIHGGYGYVKKFHVERLMRDAKITQIYEGTSEIQKMVISRVLLH